MFQKYKKNTKFSKIKKILNFQKIKNIKHFKQIIFKTKNYVTLILRR